MSMLKYLTGLGTSEAVMEVFDEQSPFTIKQVYESFDGKAESVALFEGEDARTGPVVIVGLSDGYLHAYSLKTQTVRKKRVGSKPIKSVQVIGSIQGLMSLCDGVVSLHRLSDLSTAFTLPEVKGATLFACNSRGPVHNLCVIVKRKMLLYRSVGDKRPHKEIVLQDQPTFVNFCGSHISLAYRSGYQQFRYDTQTTTDMPITLDRGIPSTLTTLPGDQFLFSAGNEGLVLDAESEITEASLKWQIPPRALGVAFPFIVGLSPNALEVHNINDQQRVQLLALGKEEILAGSPVTMIADNTRNVIVASPNKLFILEFRHQHRQEPLQDERPINYEGRLENKVLPSIFIEVDNMVDSTDFGVDYEPFERGSNYERRFKDLLVYPEDDVDVKVENSQRSSECLQDIHLLEPYIEECVRCFTAPKKRVVMNYAQYNKVFLHPLREQTYEVDFDFGQPSEEFDEEEDSQWLTELVQPFSLTHAKRQREKDRQLLFHCHSPEWDWNGGVDTIFLRNVSRDAQSNQLQRSKFFFEVTLDDFSFDVGQFGLQEPYFCTLALYDVQNNVKISENYHFFRNTHMLTFLPQHQYYLLDRSVLASRTAQFCVEGTESDGIMMVLRVERVLQEEPEQSVEQYASPRNYLQGPHKVMEKRLEDICSRLGAYRTPFAWAAVPLFRSNKEGEAALFESRVGDAPPEPVAFSFPKLYFQRCGLGDVSLMETIGDPKKATTIPGKVAGLVSPITADEYGQVPEAFCVRGFSSTPQVTPIKETSNIIYVYPQNINFSSMQMKTPCRNVAIRVEYRESDSTVDGQQGMQVICGRNSSQTMTNTYLTQVTYNSKSPHFNDEIKIALPHFLNSSHHLFFTFLHINSKATQGAGNTTESVIGYAVLRIFSDHTLLGEDHMLPVFLQMKTQYLSPKVSEKLPKLDGGKSSFRLRVHSLSTIYPQDEGISHFFNKFPDHVLGDGYGPEPSEGNWAETVADLQQASPVYIVRYLHVVLNRLFYLLCGCPYNDAQHEIVAMLFHCLHMTESKIIQDNVADKERHPILVDYVQNYFDNIPDCTTSVYLPLMKAWGAFLRQRDASGLEMGLKYAWFMFDVIVKSMIMELKQKKILHEVANRSARFGPEVNFTIQEICRQMISHISDVPPHSPTTQNRRLYERRVKSLNVDLAFFLRDLLSIYDRGFVMEIIREYLTRLDFLPDLKFVLLEVVADYEHLVPLSLPFLSNKIDSISQLVHNLGKKHFLAGLLLREVVSCFDIAEKSDRIRAISLLSDVLTKHDYDYRYQDRELKERVAGIYFALIPMLIDNHSKLLEMDKIEKRLFLVGSLFVIKNAGRELLKSWWRQESVNRLELFIDLLEIGVNAFEYRGHDMPKRDQMPGAKRTEEEEMLTLMDHLPDEVVELFKRKIIWEGNLSTEVSFITLDVLMDFMLEFQEDIADIEPVSPIFTRLLSLFRSFLHTNQSEAFMLCYFDSLRFFVSTFGTVLFSPACYGDLKDLCVGLLKLCNGRTLSVRRQACSCFYLLLQQNFETTGTVHTMKRQATVSISKLVDGLKDDMHLRHSLAVVRGFADSQVQGLIRRSSSAHVAQSPAASKGSLPERSVEIFKAGERKTLLLASEDSLGDQRKSLFGGPKDTHRPVHKSKGRRMTRDEFYEEVSETVKCLDDVLVNTSTLRLQRATRDPETVASWYFRVAEGYKAAPELHLEFMKTLSLYQRDHGYFAEAAMCMLERFYYVKNFYHESGRPLLNSHNFHHSPMMDGPGDPLSEDELVECLTNAISFLNQAELYEASHSVYKLLIPIHEANRRYKEMATCYQELSELFYTTAQKNDENSRELGCFYRVAFIGKQMEDMCGDLCNHQYVYREPSYTRLGDISERLKTTFTTLLNTEVRIVGESSDLRSLRAEAAVCCFIQITSVQPYVEEHENRVTVFEKYTNIDKFVFETPYTLSGGAHGQLSEQCKRKTFLTVSESFPCIFKRLRIVRKEEVNMSPIENAIENITTQTRKLEYETHRDPPKRNNLQAVLQGSVLTSVNVGPKETCATFLGGSLSNEDSKHILLLGRRMLEFVRACKAAVRRNKTLIEQNQLALQHALEDGLEKLDHSIQPYLRKHGISWTALESGGESSSDVN